MGPGAAAVGAHRLGGVRLHPAGLRDLRCRCFGAGCGRSGRGTGDAVFTQVRRRYGRAATEPDGGELAGRAGAPRCGQCGVRVCAHPGPHHDGRARGAGGADGRRSAGYPHRALAGGHQHRACRPWRGRGLVAGAWHARVVARDRQRRVRARLAARRRPNRMERSACHRARGGHSQDAARAGCDFGLGAGEKRAIGGLLGSSSNGMDRVYPAHIP